MSYNKSSEKQDMDVCKIPLECSLHNRTLGFHSQVQNFKINWAGKIHVFTLLEYVASFSDIYNIVIACTTTLI